VTRQSVEVVAVRGLGRATKCLLHHARAAKQYPAAAPILADILKKCVTHVVNTKDPGVSILVDAVANLLADPLFIFSGLLVGLGEGNYKELLE
jgi:hypothetical protein